MNRIKYLQPGTYTCMLILLVIYDGILKMPKLYRNRNRELGIGSYTVEDIEHVGSFFF